MPERDERTELTEEELEQLDAEALPDREVMTVIDPGKTFTPGAPPDLTIQPNPGFNT